MNFNYVTFNHIKGLLTPEIFMVDVDQHVIVMEEVFGGRTLKQKIKELESVTSPGDELKQISSNIGHLIGKSKIIWLKNPPK